MEPLGPDETHWWRAVQEVACGRKQWNRKTTCSTAGTQRENFGAASRFETQWRPICFSKDLGQGKTEVLLAKYEKRPKNGKYENCTLCQALYTAETKNLAHLQNNQRWDTIQQSGSWYPWTCYTSIDRRSKIHTYFDGQFLEIRGSCSPSKECGRKCWLHRPHKSKWHGRTSQQCQWGCLFEILRKQSK